MNDDDYELTLEHAYDLLKEELSALYEMYDISVRDQISSMKRENKNPLTRIYNYYDNKKIRPYYKKRDFNNQGNNNIGMEDNKPHTAHEIGIVIEF